MKPARWRRTASDGYMIASKKTKKGRTGLGAKIVKDVVDAHKGKIWLESEPGGGTTFQLRFPLDPTTGHSSYM